MPWIDGSLFPDRDVPKRLQTLTERVDFISRLCAAWDYGILPDAETIAEVRRPHWRAAVDECRMLTSPVYHLLRQWHGLEKMSYLGPKIPYIAEDPELNSV